MATASLQVSAGKPIIMYKTAETEMASGHDYFDIYKDTQKSLLKSPLVIEAALRPPEINALPSVQRNETNAVGWLTNELNVNFATVNSEIMNVSLIGDNPQEITTLVNAVVSAYLSKIVDKEREKSVAHCDTLDGLRADKETEVRALLNNLRQLAEQAGGTGDKEALSIRQRVAVEQFAQYRSELMRVQFELMRARSSLKTQQAYLASLEDADIPAWEVDQYALADPTSRDLQLKLSYYNTNVAQFRNIIVPGRKLPPAVQKIESDRDVVQQQIDEIGKGYRDKIRERKRSEAEKEIRRAEAEVAVLTDQEQHFQADTEQQRKEIEKIGGQSIEIENGSGETEEHRGGLGQRGVRAGKTAGGTDVGPPRQRYWEVRGAQGRIPAGNAVGHHRTGRDVGFLPARVRPDVVGRALPARECRVRGRPRPGPVGDRLGAGHSGPGAATVGQ